MPATRPFSDPGVHHLAFAEDHCGFAGTIRQELLAHPYEASRHALPHCPAFRDFLLEQVVVDEHDTIIHFGREDES